MKIYAIVSIILTFFMLMFPVAAVSAGGIEKTQSTTEAVTNDTQEEKESEPSDSYENNSERTKASSDGVINVLRVSSGKVTAVNERDYIIGSVACEISPLSEKEAIKAQAVACYTYAKYKKENNSNTDGSDISDSSETCQGYMDNSELKKKWGGNYKTYYNKISACVDEVLGEYMTYKGKTIIAPYHAISPGKTEDASVIWGKSLGYLKSVSAPGDTLCGEYDSVVSLSKEEFKKRAEKLGSVNLSGNYSDWVGKSKTSSVGYVEEISIGGESFDGNQVRTAFSLRSPYFTVSHEDGNMVFHVKGYGHGLGMSQNSADYMARQGKTYDEILRHFYSGIKIEKER